MTVPAVCALPCRDLLLLVAMTAVAIGPSLMVAIPAMADYPNHLARMHLLVTAGVGKILAQSVAIVLVTPLNFVGNKLWSFRR